ncbi:MAG: hypothetical protein QY326_06945 [Bdellovibrionota bacterium]|nr:MAG: hypothetical protein QY326_06945 [Bdellovibrionota bacterium]
MTFNFSTFTAISELFVTAGVLYIVRRGWLRQRIPWGLALGLVIFEFSVNMLYMISRMGATPLDALSTSMKILYAVHGTLSLLVFIAFALMVLLAFLEAKKGRHFFADHKRLTASFVVFWLLSVGSGEVIYILRHL